MGSAVLGLVVDSSLIIEAERAGQTVEDLLIGIQKRFGEIDIAISAVTVAELVHGVGRAKDALTRARRRAFIDEIKKNIPVHLVTAETGEIAGIIGGDQAARGFKLPIDDFLIGASAIEQGYGVATLNFRHLRKIPGLTIVD